MGNFIWENKSNAGAQEGRSFTGTINGEKRTITGIRYSINVPTFQTLEAFCSECATMSEAGQANLLSLVNVAISNAYMNKATELVARDVPVEDFTLETFFTMSGNREGVNKAIEMAEEALQELAMQKMEALASVNGILTQVIAGKIKMEEAPAIQAELTAKVAEIDGRIAEQNERLVKLQAVKEEQAQKNKERGLKAAAARKENASK